MAEFEKFDNDTDWYSPEKGREVRFFRGFMLQVVFIEAGVELPPQFAWSVFDMTASDALIPVKGGIADDRAQAQGEAESFARKFKWSSVR